eukprot:Selendium_serpulae@DN1018_c0_g1_i1.p1
MQTDSPQSFVTAAATEFSSGTPVASHTVSESHGESHAAPQNTSVEMSGHQAADTLTHTAQLLATNDTKSYDSSEPGSLPQFAGVDNLEKDSDKTVEEHEVDVVIIGAGLTGVIAAHRLINHHKVGSVLVLESNAWLGGCLDTRHCERWPLPTTHDCFASTPEAAQMSDKEKGSYFLAELGANSFALSPRNLDQLRAMGIADSDAEARPTTKAVTPVAVPVAVPVGVPVAVEEVGAASVRRTVRN